MATTYSLISSVTVGATAVATMEFTSIPQTYTDLKIVISARNNGTPPGNILIGFNSNASSFTNIFLQGDGANGASSNVAQMVGDMDGSGETANTFNNIEVYIPNYASSTFKSFSSDSVNENNATTAYQQFTANLWSNTSAITSIQITNRTSPRLFVQHSTAYLYGISKA
jgi:hypothetical protein